MKITLLSDTHSYIDHRILAHCTEADEVWHAGDIGTFATAEAIQKTKTLRAVYGNIDGTEIRQAFPLHNVFLCEGLKIFITHIGGYPGRYSKAALEVIQMEKPDIFICGHSHILKVMRDPVYNLLHINPGAAGRHGFHKIRTLVKFEVSSAEIRNLQVVELGPRVALP